MNNKLNPINPEFTEMEWKKVIENHDLLLQPKTSKSQYIKLHCLANIGIETLPKPLHDLANKTIRKRVWTDKRELALFKQEASRHNVSVNELIRRLLIGFTPKIEPTSPHVIAIYEVGTDYKSIEVSSGFAKIEEGLINQYIDKFYDGYVYFLNSHIEQASPDFFDPETIRKLEQSDFDYYYKSINKNEFLWTEKFSPICSAAAFHSLHSIDFDSKLQDSQKELLLNYYYSYVALTDFGCKKVFRCLPVANMLASVFPEFDTADPKMMSYYFRNQSKENQEALFNIHEKASLIVQPCAYSEQFYLNK
ncbi:MAG: hypothetical protein SFZ03_10195 [Candidatus Melainabacteria bacterium]|nr:hypothetical protein [Candidatus Melainabacteria bacterium]